MKKIARKQFAYFAGLFDGEGGIYIEKQSNYRYRMKSPKYSLIVQLTNNYYPIIDRMVELFNGYKRERKRFYNNIPYSIYDWRTSAKKAVKFLRLLYPYLVIKKKQAEIGIKFQSQKRIGQQALSDDQLKFFEECHQQIKQLNRQWSDLRKYRAEHESAGVETENEVPKGKDTVRTLWQHKD